MSEMFHTLVYTRKDILADAWMEHQFYDIKIQDINLMQNNFSSIVISCSNPFLEPTSTKQ